MNAVYYLPATRANLPHSRICRLCRHPNLPASPSSKFAGFAVKFITFCLNLRHHAQRSPSAEAFPELPYGRRKNPTDTAFPCGILHANTLWDAAFAASPSPARQCPACQPDGFTACPAGFGAEGARTGAHVCRMHRPRRSLRKRLPRHSIPRLRHALSAAISPFSRLLPLPFLWLQPPRTSARSERPDAHRPEDARKTGALFAPAPVRRPLCHAPARFGRCRKAVGARGAHTLSPLAERVRASALPQSRSKPPGSRTACLTAQSAVSLCGDIRIPSPRRSRTGCLRDRHPLCILPILKRSERNLPSCSKPIPYRNMSPSSRRADL